MTALVVRTARIGLVEAWDVQRELADLRRAGRIPDVLWLLEHPPVYTYGRHASRDDLHAQDEELERLGASVHQVDRGGRMTWHGPGQTTAYLIWRVGGRVGPRRFVEALVDAAADASGLPEARADHARPGVYVAGRKLASVGVRIAQGVTTHGLALNRDCDLAWFERMVACGMADVAPTSVLAAGGDPDRGRVEDGLLEAVGERLGTALEPGELDVLMRRRPVSTDDRPNLGERPQYAPSRRGRNATTDTN